MKRPSPSGILVVDKPPGPTSFAVVARVRSAVGVLPLCLGDATKIAGWITEGDKGYRATVRLGVETDTLDGEGREVTRAELPPLDREKLEAALARFRGGFEQLPPMFSAVKVGGERLYQAARRGEEVERKARPVTVTRLALLDFSADTFSIEVEATKGFFVRVLAQELARALGTVGHLASLCRYRSGPFTLEGAVPLSEIEAAAQDPAARARVLSRLLPLEAAVGDVPEVKVSAQDAERVSHGQPLEVAARPGRVRVVGPDGALLALAEVQPDRRLKYVRVLWARRGERRLAPRRPRAYKPPFAPACPPSRARGLAREGEENVTRCRFSPSGSSRSSPSTVSTRRTPVRPRSRSPFSPSASPS